MGRRDLKTEQPNVGASTPQLALHTPVCNEVPHAGTMQRGEGLPTAELQREILGSERSTSPQVRRAFIFSSDTVENFLRN